MADIKNLFEKNKSSGILANSTLKKVGDTVESADYVVSNLKEKTRFVPYVDFSSASNFARYGSAEKYYSDSIGYIANEYPYDGSLKERINWKLTASYLDLYMFEHEYPRTNGYILMGKTYGTPVADAGGYDTFSTSEQEYIYLQGSPHPSTGSGDLRTNWKEYNLYNTASLGRYNLEIDGDNGLTVEFWLNKDDYSSANESSKEVIFDLWNSGTYGDSDYGRFRVEITGGATADVLDPVFNIELRSGSSGFSYRSDITGPHSTTVSLSSSTSFTGSWNHFALSFQNTGSNMLGRLYRNGKLEHSLITGSNISSVTGAMISTIGSLVTSVSGTYGAQGAAKLSSSLDDFRYWRRMRSTEKVGKYWFVPVGGGTNSDISNVATASTKYSYENPLDLGVYYKFNEGIINSTRTISQDSIILDYSGRTTNGSWVGYEVGARFTGSAMVLSNAAKSEFKDPIIYTNNPAVANLTTTRAEEGLLHDQQNNASIYHSFPAWIIEEDEDRGRDVLKNLIQIMGSYFDTLQLQIQSISKIKDLKYPSGSNKPYPFANRLVDNMGLVSSEVFENANALEFLASRDDHRTYVRKLNETKNIIYQNIYNNLIYIFKSKGTEKSFRNLIRCYGIDEELVKLSLYGNDVTYELRNNGDNRVIKKRYVDFNKNTRFNATVFQQTSSTNANSRAFISSSSEVLFRGNTYEAEAIFPEKLNFANVNYVENDFTVASLYGCHTSGTAGAWATSDVGNFQVRSVRPNIYSTEAYFHLTGTSGGYFPSLSSSLFKDVYDNSRWNFAVKIKPSKYPLADGVSGSATGSYNVEFSGYNYVLDVLVNSFETSASISSGSAWDFLNANKRFFVGAHRTNFNGAVLQKADSKISSVRVWMDYLKPETVKAHAKDVENFGSEYPYKNAYISQLSKSLGSNFVQIPQIETLAMDWNFDTITTSNASGEFTVPDFSSGSTSLTNRWGWLGPITKYQHTGLGYGFEASDTGSIDRRYIHSVKQQPPEVLNSSDMVSIIDDTTRQIYSRDSRPIDYYFAFEKSMYGIVSEQMLNYFSTIVAFNNLIGEPVNRYRQDYKDMEKLRALYFERVENTPDFEKFVEYFKWIDASLGIMLMQLTPASADFSQKLRNMVESHILERNKYWTKFPSLEMKGTDPEAGLQGINELLYSGKRGLAPITGTVVPNSSTNCEWWLDRANRDNPNITSGDSIVDTQRDTIRLANDFRSVNGPTLAVSRDSTDTTTTYTGQAYALRNFTKTYKLTVDESPEIHGGSNFPRNKTVEYTHEALKFDSSEQLTIAGASVPAKDECEDVIDPNSKFKLDAKVANSTDPEGYLSGKASIFAPFSIYSSSVQSGYESVFPSAFKRWDINNYHDDIYGDDKGIPVQGPFTEAHVGGRQHRHININTASTDTTDTRAEAWNLTLASSNLTITTRTAHQPRATMIRDAYAKRPINIANLKWGTGSQVAGNYQIDYQMLQTSGRKINNRFFVKNEGFAPPVSQSAWIDGLIDYALPRYDISGSNKYIFVERFNAPGGPDVSSRGSMDINAEEYSVYNDLNQRNSIVRNALQDWQTDHCGQFGIDFARQVAIPGGLTIIGPGEPEGYRQPRWQDYDTLASYHKVNRNGRSTVLINDFNREVEWVELVNTSLSDFNRTLSNSTTTLWGAYAKSNQIVETTGYLEFEVASISAVAWAVGLSSDDTRAVAPTFWDFSIVHSGAGNVRIYEGNNLVFSSGGGFVAVGDGLRIYREKTQILYQHRPKNSIIWTTFYRNTSSTPVVEPVGNYYPRAAFEDAVTSITNPRISNPQYDNWYVQHAIPQSELQYAWINDSYDRSKDQPFGHASNYSVPSGTTSTTASSVQFVTASDFGSYDYLSNIAWGRSAQGGAIIPTDFANINWNVYEPITSSENNLGYPLGVPLTTAGTVTQYQNLYAVPIRVGTFLAETFNALMLHRNGPYQYPSWKQIRTGEHPVARYQKRNNILSVMPPPEEEIVINGAGTGKEVANYIDQRSDSFRNFIEPPVDFKYKPLDIEQVSAGSTITLRSTYGNNTCLFTQGPNNNADGTISNETIYNFLKRDAYKSDKQIYDIILDTPSLKDGLASTLYRETIYPRGTNTGLAQTRGRTKYAEVANVDASGFAILSTGSNGIDRGPIERRTFWKDSVSLRNRTAGYVNKQFDWYEWYDCIGGACVPSGPEHGYSNGTITVSQSYWLTGTLPNSQGYKDGCATSIYGLGRTPIVWDFSWYFRYEATDNGLGPGTNCYEKIDMSQNPGWFYGGSFLATGLGQKNDWGKRSFTTPNDFPDRGELNSANYQTIAGYAGTAASSSSPNFLAGYNCTTYPTASVYYYHLPWFNTKMFLTGTWNASPGGSFHREGAYTMTSSNQTCTGPAPAQSVSASAYGPFGVYGMRWRTEELSGKKAWFDSYEDYAEDIRGVGKNLTIIPQFNISEHMPYYVKNGEVNFQKNNDKFLSLPGGNLSSSADAYPTLTEPRTMRGFDEKFFNDYSNSDFQRYFGKFNKGADYDANQTEISLKCNVVKKLLPYQGFYPHQRTLQLASLFSQSIAPHISGLSWSVGQPSAAGAEFSGALAVQSLLQPYFAPGILYNTIKSGIACDWASFTGSAISSSSRDSTKFVQAVAIENKSNYRIPFESLLDPLGSQGIPKQDDPPDESNDQQNLNLLYPTYHTGSNAFDAFGRSVVDPGGVPASAVFQPNFTGSDNGGRWCGSWANSRKPYVKIQNDKRSDAQGSSEYSLYQMAMSNFLAEVPNFFLEKDDFGNSLTTFVSKAQNEIDVTAGSVYYMDIVLSKGSKLVMWEDYYNFSPTSATLNSAGDTSPIMGKGIDGHSFGPPLAAGAAILSTWNVYDDTLFSTFSGSGLPNAPAFAAYTPPYYYGSSTARFIYTASANTFTWDDFFKNTNVQYFNDELNTTFHSITGSEYSHANPAPASASMMTLSSSLNLFGKFSGKSVTYDDLGNVTSVTDASNEEKGNDRWVISTKMETPVLDFSASYDANGVRIKGTPREFGYSRGMWGGYGNRDQLVGGKAITLELAQSFYSEGPPGYDANENDWLKKAFVGIGHRKEIGQIRKRRKDISEAIVAIPYVTSQIRPGPNQSKAYTTKNQILGKWLFSLGHQSAFDDRGDDDAYSSYEIFDKIKRNLKTGTKAAIPVEFGRELGLWAQTGGTDTGGGIRSTSISRMIPEMNKYVIPPEIDFNTYDTTEDRIEPFVMYIFEFTHKLDQQDLVDIWQGLMPEISTTAELDSKTVKHPRMKYVEFFGDRAIPDEIRWMVFKVKKKAENNYYKMTADTKDDQNFAGNPFTVGTGEIPFSYNWPYDYFSLIELAELEAGSKFKK